MEEFVSHAKMLLTALKNDQQNEVISISANLVKVSLISKLRSSPIFGLTPPALSLKSVRKILDFPDFQSRITPELRDATISLLSSIISNAKLFASGNLGLISKYIH